jgi:hypothetical protein
LINWMMRLSIDSTRDREKEEAARDEFSRTGHWPDERERRDARSTRHRA